MTTVVEKDQGREGAPKISDTVSEQKQMWLSSSVLISLCLHFYVDQPRQISRSHLLDQWETKVSM